MIVTADELKRQHSALAAEIDALVALDYPAEAIASAIRIAGEHDLEPAFSLWALADLLRRMKDRRQDRARRPSAGGPSEGEGE
jgi:sugar/nucleoside kinase (ribokinase family)